MFMRLAIPAIAALLLVTAPSAAPAQDLGRVLGPLVRPVDSLLRRGTRKVLRPYAYRARARAVRAPVASRRAVAQAQDQASRPQMMLGQVAQPKPFWPDAPQNIFDYVLLQKEAGLWGHGYGTIIVSMFAQPPKADDARGGARLTASGSVEQTTGAAPSAEMVCGERGVNRAEEMTKQVAGMLALADDQQSVLAELRSALRQAEEDTIAACPNNAPANLPERLQTMQDRLWAMRVMGTSLRAPLQKFHDALTSEQKAKLDAQPARSESRANAPSRDAAMQCYALAQLAPQWPAAQIARAVRLNKDQQVAFGTLSETSSQMGQLMMGSCPKKTAATPLARLDATLDWIDAMLFAGTNVAVAVDDFYGSLSEEQKARLDKLDL